MPASEAGGFEDITKDTSTLLTQLDAGGGTQAQEPASGASPTHGASQLTAEDVFRAAGIGDDANASPRLIKLIAGLSMFPKEQQIAMFRAMDAADETWSEDAVGADARRRVQVLREHLDALSAERQQLLDGLGTDIARTKEGGAAVIAELDRQIAELYARREQEATQTAAAVARLEQQQLNVRQMEATARQGISAVIHSLSGLMSFLGVPPTSERN